MIELLHPDGSASTSFVLGGNCPETLFPTSSIQTHQKIELFILAPTTTECASDRWLESAAELVSRRLSDDGVCYMLVPPPWRVKMLRLLAPENLVIDSSFWHFPSCSTSAYLIPLRPGPAQYAVEMLVSGPFWKRMLATKLFRYTQAHNTLSMRWKPVGITVRRPNARPLFQWLFDRNKDGPTSGTAIVRKSWRRSRGANIVYRFNERDAQPSAIVKTVPENTSIAGLDREAKILGKLGAGLKTSGVDVPQVLRNETTDHRSSLFLSPLRGRSASDLLTSNSDMLFPILTTIVDWLEQWHSTTICARSLDAEQLDRSIFIPLEQLAPFLQNARAYQTWLSKQIRIATAAPIHFVATHNDLTMANVLVADHNELAIVDWETGIAEGLPVVDFCYAVTDAIRIAHRHVNWLDAFKACYESNGRYTRQVHSWEERLRSAIGISTGFSELCFHACWLHHASNEHEVSHPDDPRPFLEIVQWLALNCETPHAN